MGHAHDVIDELRGSTRSLREAAPAAWEGFSKLHDAAVADGVLSARVKELMALAIAVVKACDGCIAYHAKAAARQGASREEVAEALSVALMMDGGTATVYGPRLGRFRGVRGPRCSCRGKPVANRKPTRVRVKRDVGPYLIGPSLAKLESVATRIVILGGGTGGTLTANRLRHVLDDAVEIVVVDQDDTHVYQPGLLFVPFGLAHLDEITRPRRRQLHGKIGYRRAAVDHVDLDAERVWLDDGTRLDYDVLVVATGSTLVPEETEGLTGPGWMEKVFTFYTPEGAVALHDALERLRRGSPRGRRRRHAHQVPGRAAGVLLPRRLVLPRARHT